MVFTIENGKLTVSADELGAELTSIRPCGGGEYLWQGAPEIWKRRAPNLFPFIGRLYNGEYAYGGKTYKMPIHGFAPASLFTCDEHKADAMRFTLRDSDASREIYPFEFAYSIEYALRGNRLNITHRVANHSPEALAFAIGAHPGFNIPLEEGSAFEDYYLEFNEPCDPEQVLLSENLLPDDRYGPYPIEDNRRIRLNHAMFNNDAIVLKNVSKAITLKSSKGDRGVCVRYPDMPYLGLWQKPFVNAPYLCIEPWSALPGRDGITEDLARFPNFTHLQAGQVYETSVSYEIF